MRDEIPVLAWIVMVPVTLLGFVGSIAWLRGTTSGWLGRGVQRMLLLHKRADLPVLLRNLPYAWLPVSLAIASMGLAAALMALDLGGALAFFLGANALALGAVATWFAYSPPSWLIPRWLDETRRAMPPMRPHRWDRFMVVVLLVLTIPSALFVMAAGLYMLLAVGWFG